MCSQTATQVQHKRMQPKSVQQKDVRGKTETESSYNKHVQAKPEAY